MLFCMYSFCKYTKLNGAPPKKIYIFKCEIYSGYFHALIGHRALGTYFIQAIIEKPLDDLLLEENLKKR